MLGTTLNPGSEKNVHAIFISHDHWDHFDSNTIMKLLSPSTGIYCPENLCTSLYHEITFEAESHEHYEELKSRVFPLKIGDLIRLNEIRIKCIGASEGLSYLFLCGDNKVLFMGDSVATIEMIAEKPDVILFPVWAVRGEEARLEAFLNLVKESRCIPMHYHHNPNALPNFYVSPEDFQYLLKMNVDIEILERNKTYLL